LKSREYYARTRERKLAYFAAHRVPKPRFCRVCGEPAWSPKSPYCTHHSEEAAERRRHRRGRTTQMAFAP